MNLLLIGCGNIGRSLLSSWHAASFWQHLIVVQPSLTAAKLFQASKRLEFVKHIDEIPASFHEDVVVLAMKPQQADVVLAQLANRSHCSMLVSLLAGVQLQELSTSTQNPAAKNSRQPPKIIRLMPNMAIQTAKSVHLAFCAQTLDSLEQQYLQQLFGLSGWMTWLKTEAELDGLTAISGSGPAYFFLLAELLLQETLQRGITEENARGIIQQLFIGSASLLQNNQDFTALIQSVASKKGVTQVALQAMAPLMKESLHTALSAADNRLRELSDENRR